jgi:hypothetical protein
MKQIVMRELAPVNQNGLNETVTVALSPAESQRNYAIQGWLGLKNFAGNDKTRVILPHDGDVKKAQALRYAETRRQLAQPWGNVFMVTDTDGKRLNNISQQSFISQPRLTIPNSYGQFYAFMHALSAAFGTLQGGS